MSVPDHCLLFYFVTTVLIRFTVLCILGARNGHFNGFLPFRAIKTHTTAHSDSDRAKYMFVGLQGTTSTNVPQSNLLATQMTIECNRIACFPASYFDYDHLHLKLILLKHLGQGKLCKVSGGSRNCSQT